MRDLLEALLPPFSVADRLRGLRVLVGNTPLLAIDYSVDGSAPRRLFAKAENVNMTGSIKDRMALHILRHAIESEELQPGGLIVEATSGNTGISFAAIGRALGHPVRIFMPDWMSAERIALIRSFGATIRLVSPAEGGFVGAIRLAEELAAATSDAILMAQRLAGDLGLGVGISSGANFLAAVEVQAELGSGAVAVTVFCDSNKKYLSTDLLREEPVQPWHRAPHVQLLGFRATNRVCEACFDASDPANAPEGFFEVARRLQPRS